MALNIFGFELATYSGVVMNLYPADILVVRH